jgi:hypothetical protein
MGAVPAAAGTNGASSQVGEGPAEVRRRHYPRPAIPIDGLTDTGGQP